MATATDTEAPPFPRHVMGTWTLLSSMVHGGDETLGTTKLFRTKGWVHEGRRIQIPVISGNAIRGIWRRMAARAFLDAYVGAGGEPITLSAFYYLTSGGALHKGSSGASLDILGEADLRRLIPFVGLFGGAGLGKIQEGKIYVDEGVPVCVETVERLAEVHPRVRDAETAKLSIRELTEIHGYSRQDDAKNAWWRPYIESGERKQLEMAIQQKQESDVADEAGSPHQMRYEQAELVAGTVVFHRWGFRWPPNRDELAGLGAGLLRWAERPQVGGRNAVGHGNLLLSYEGVTPETRLIGDGSKPLTAFQEATPEEALVTHVREHLDEIRQVLGAL